MIKEYSGGDEIGVDGVCMPIGQDSLPIDGRHIYSIMFYPGAYWWKGPGIDVDLMNIEIGCAQLYAHYKTRSMGGLSSL